MSVQTVTIQLDPASAAILRALQHKAQTEGIPLDSLLQSLTANIADLNAAMMSPEQRAEDFYQWAKAHSVKGVIADDSRESIYTREDDAL